MANKHDINAVFGTMGFENIGIDLMKAFKKLTPFFINAAKNPSVFWTALFILTYVSVFFLSGTSPIGYRHLEHSWNAVLEYAAAQNMQFGEDIVFTYGPFGYLNGPVSQGFLIPQRILFAFAWSGVVAWAVIRIAKKMAKISRYVFLAWILISANIFNLEQHTYLLMACGCMVLMDDPLKHKTEAVAFLTFFVFLALVKFTFFIAAVTSVAVCCIVQLSKGNVKSAASVAIFFGAVFLAFWLATGQHLTSLWPWIRGGMEITGGYSEAMSIFPRQNVFLASATAGILFLVAVVIRALSLRLTVENLGFLFTTVLYAFLSWKQGFVRADGHVLYFIIFLPIAFALLLTEPVRTPLSRKALRSLNLLYLVIVILCITAANLQSPGVVRQRLTSYPDRLLENARLILKSPVGECTNRYTALSFPSQEELDFANSLTIPRAIIGNATVDVISFHQMAALSTKLNYHPRPVIQSYSAFTPYLQNLNLSFFRSGRRPEYIFFKMETIDNRFPTLDEATNLPYILQNYMPVWHDDYILLLKLRTQEPYDLHLKKISEQVITFGEPINLSAWGRSVILMRVDVKPTIIGRLIKFIFQPPGITLHTNTGREIDNYRFIPTMAKEGFIISPLLNYNNDIIKFFQNEGQQIESIYFSKPDSFWEQYANRITVELYRFQ